MDFFALGFIIVFVTSALMFVLLNFVFIFIEKRKERNRKMCDKYEMDSETLSSEIDKLKQVKKLTMEIKCKYTKGQILEEVDSQIRFIQSQYYEKLGKETDQKMKATG